MQKIKTEKSTSLMLTITWAISVCLVILFPSIVEIVFGVAVIFNLIHLAASVFVSRMLDKDYEDTCKQLIDKISEDLDRPFSNGNEATTVNQIAWIVKSWTWCVVYFTLGIPVVLVVVFSIILAVTRIYRTKIYNEVFEK